MTFLPQPARFSLPELAPPRTRAPFPLIATLAPIGVAIVAWIVTGSAFALLFALLGPVVAVAGVVDSRLHGRRSRRAHARATVVDLGRLADDIAERASRERADLAQFAPPPHPEVAPGRAAAALSDGRVPVRLGVGGLPDRVAFDGAEPAELPAEVRTALERVRAATALLGDAPIVVDARGGIGIVGPPVAARALARSLALQLVAALPDARVAVPTDESWAATLPRDGSRGVADGIAAGWRVSSGELTIPIVWVDSGAVPIETHTLLRLDGGEARIELPHEARAVVALRPAFLTVAMAARIARGIADRAGENRPELPEVVGLAELLADDGGVDQRTDAAPSKLLAPIGHDGTGAVWLDLVGHGPHALVAGTTGSGKSELLVSWVVALASRYPPSDVTFLLVDFKGGAAFAPLTGLPHVLGTVSDLDGRLTTRVIESLRADLRRRESVLAAHGVRAIDELPRAVLARLVIVVDEFAALVTEYPDLHQVFADLAARGRSLGLHLVLCTQRPAGVVRDAVLANVTLRISLRVTDRADSIAVCSTDSAASLPAHPRGRAILVDGDAPPRPVQLALAEPSTIARLQGGSADPADPGGPADPAFPDASAAPARPWCDPLPERISLDELPATMSGLPFGLADLPAELSQPVAVHEPESHGALLVIGAPGSGKSTTLATLASSARQVTGDVAVEWLPRDPADAWHVLTRLLETDSAAPSGPLRLVLIDDLDAVLAGFEPDYRVPAVELLARLLREAPARGLGLVAATRSLGGAVASLATGFGSRLLLRAASREEHVLAGGHGASFVPDAVPGSGVWRGLVVQVALSDGIHESRESGGPLGPSFDRPVELPVIVFDPEVPTAVVSTRPRETRELLSPEVRVEALGDSAGRNELRLRGAGRPTVVLGDPDAWTADWARWTVARREGQLVLHGCSISDHRALTRSRELPPPLGTRRGECWLVRDGVTERALLVGAGRR